ALVHGFRSFGTVRVGGVILNRLGSDGHERMCREAVEELGLPVLGALHEHAEAEAPSRHLGLIPAAERRAEAVEGVRRLGDLVAASCDLDAVLALARAAPPLNAGPWDPAAGWGGAAAREAGDARGTAVAGAPRSSSGTPGTKGFSPAGGPGAAAFNRRATKDLPEGRRASA